MTTAQKLIEQTRSATREALGHLQHACRLAEIAVEGADPEAAAEYLLDALEDLRDRAPSLRRAAKASRAIP